MANNSSRIKVSDLDFDDIKSNLKNYLRAQEQFSDYDFEGAGLSILLDVLAYNTHYNALYTNLAVNENFLDSASKRSSVVSIAKTLGYTPRSATSARAVIRVIMTNPVSFPQILTLPKHSTFTTNVNGVAFTFYTPDDITIVYDNVSYVFDNVTIIEGTPLSFKYTVAAGQKYIIPNANADISTLKVRVQDSASGDTFHTYSPAASLVELTPEHRVYFIKEIDGGMFEISFGDDILSSAVVNGNIVHLEYFVSNRDAVNGARVFTYNGSSLIGGSIVVSTISIAAGGAEPESIESIKFNAPKLYTAQNRAVTPDDYKALIYSNYPDIKSVSVWGGEDNTPPVYGKTFICAKPYNSTILTNQRKSDILNSLLASKTVVSITPVIVDPEYINIELNVTVYYNDRETIKSANEIETEVIASIAAYNNSDLQKFDGVFRFSKLSRLIDMCDPAITHNITTVIIRRLISPRYNISAEYNINLINPIYTDGDSGGSVSSTGFYIDNTDRVHYLEDDGVGNLVLYYINTNKVIENPKIGTVDYNNGVILIRNLYITSLASSSFELSIKPSSNDVVSAYTQIAEIDNSNLTVRAIADKTANGDIRGGINYQFATSRP